MSDKRLIGTWKSDTRKTMKEIRNRKDIPKVKQEKIKKLFGKLTIRYTRTRAYTEFKGSKSVDEYSVLGKDEDSVAIMTTGIYDEDKIYHINFEGNYYWLWAYDFKEYFKRVE